MKTIKPVIFLTFANDKVDDALYLRNLPLELNNIRLALDKAVKAGLCEVVERTAVTVDDIFDTFQDPYYKDRIAIFHYGGHASGTQLVLETLDGSQEVSNSSGLVPFLAKQKSLQVAFFNGCASQQQSMELIEAGVPAVIGTSTAINDSIATEISGRFYNGIASGSSIHQAWLEAIDIVKTKNDTTSKKRKGLKLRRDKGNDFPWNMHIRAGAEVVKDWDLPTASNNPLFGLPTLPKMDLPEEPFRFLRRYEPNHAPIFFGRDGYIRQLYDRISSEKAAPVILFFGQSGAGKSSTLASGLLPRLEQEADVKYIRRDASIGLLGTLDSALGGNFKSAVIKNDDGSSILATNIEYQIQQLEQIKATLETQEVNKINETIDILKEKLQTQFVQVDTEPVVSRLEKWLMIEKETGRPLHILLDQVEEVFTRQHPTINNELEQLIVGIQNIFVNPNHRPQGKIILSYRKEYNPEIEEFCKRLKIPREKIFLKKLGRKDIIDVVNGLNQTEQLRQYYQVSIDADLPTVIADDLLEDKDSPIAPVLSILLTKLWELSKQGDEHLFTIKHYQDLKREGILMNDFFEQQMEKIKNWNPKLEESGLALDVLNFHTTALGTAGSQLMNTLKERYQHQKNEIGTLLNKFKQLYLLTDVNQGETGLAHDTLAPIVIKEIRNSDKSGQRAFRILTSKVNEFKEDKTILLGNTDLKLVEEGKEGMRLWTPLEEELVELSRKRRAKQRRRNISLMIGGVIAVLSIIGLSIWSLQQRDKAEANALTAEGNASSAEAILSFSEHDYSKSIQAAKKALNIDSNNIKAYNSLFKSVYADFYKIDGQYYTTPTALEVFNDLENIKFASQNSQTMIVGEKITNTTPSIVVKDLLGKDFAAFDLEKGETIKSVEISENGQYIVLTGHLKNENTTTFKVWNVSTKELIYQEKGSNVKNEIPWSFSSKYKYLAVSLDDKKTNVIELSNRNTIPINQGISYLKDGLQRAKFQFLHFSPDETSIIIKDGRIFNLNERKFQTYPIKVNAATYGKIEEAKFTSDGQKAILSNSSYLLMYDLSNGNLLLNTFIESDGRLGLSDDMYLSSDGRYSISKDFSEMRDIQKKINFGERDGVPSGISLDKLYLANDREDIKSTILHLIREKDEERGPAGGETSFFIKGNFAAFSKDGNYMITREEDKYISVWSIASTWNIQLLTTLSGMFIDISVDNRYISTTNGVFDLKQNKYAVGIELENFLPNTINNLHYYFSEDAQYFIKDDGKDFEIRNTFTGAMDENIDVADYKKNKWLPFKKEFYQPIVIDNSNRMCPDSFFPELKPLTSKKHQIEITNDKNKLILKYLDAAAPQLEFFPLGHKIVDYRFIANEKAIEVVSLKRGYGCFFDIYRQLFWLDKDILIKQYGEDNRKQ